MNRLAAGVVVTPIVAGAITLRPWVPPLSDVTITCDWSGVGTRPSGNRSTSVCWPAGVIFHPCGVLFPVDAGVDPARADDPTATNPRAANAATPRRTR